MIYTDVGKSEFQVIIWLHVINIGVKWVPLTEIWIPEQLIPTKTASCDYVHVDIAIGTVSCASVQQDIAIGTASCDSVQQYIAIGTASCDSVQQDIAIWTASCDSVHVDIAIGTVSCDSAQLWYKLALIQKVYLKRVKVTKTFCIQQYITTRIYISKIKTHYGTQSALHNFKQISYRKTKIEKTHTSWVLVCILCSVYKTLLVI